MNRKILLKYAIFISFFILFSNNSVAGNVCVQFPAHSPTYDSLKIMTPFWLSDIQYNESVMMVSTYNKPEIASLLYPAHRIISVINARLTSEYSQGSDWNYLNGKKIAGYDRKQPKSSQSLSYTLCLVLFWE